MNKLKVIFMGTPVFAVPILQKLIDNYEVILVVSQPDRERDRKGNILATPVKELANKYNIPVYQPEKIRKEYQKIIDLNPDIIVTCAYGQIIPEVILNAPRFGCINVHGSLLPKYRGGAPIHHAIINGESETGITIMYMDKGMDSGDIISTRVVPILDNDNLDSLYEKMSIVGAELLIDTMPSIIDGTNNRIKQDESLVTFGYNITKEEEKISFDDTSRNIFNKIRGLSSIPGAYCYFGDLRLKIYESFITDIFSDKEPGTIINVDKTGIYVATNDNVIGITDLKLEGKKRTNIKEFVNGIKKEEYIGKVFK
ncbi:MAG: methionyl-tRNA formyltransferase [Bacilli bacterium]|nr:methionyl-tRNA formyltransferase [Bacilli bacterium]